MPDKNSKKRSKKPNIKGKVKEEKIKEEKVNRKTENKKVKKKRKHPKLMLTLKILFVLILLLCVAGAGIVAAMFFGLFGDEFEITKQQLTVGDSNTIIVDKDGNEIANLSSDEKRKIISIGEMSEYLPKAYIAIEDKRFYSHNGVDIKRTAGAIIGKLTGKSSYGGSSITQQLVKNITNEKEQSGIEGIKRKVKEWAKAIQVERMITKPQILELYLNIIYVGGSNLCGVELGSIYYFNKSAKDLDLAECAFLAGINNAPMSYDPYDTTKDQEKLAKKRTDKTLTVLKEMKDQGFVTNEEEYNAAVEKVKAGLTFTKGRTETNSTYSYHTDATIKAIIKQLMEEQNISEKLAQNYLYGSGLTIYSTQDTSIQKAVEEEFAKTKYQIPGREKNADGTSKNDHTQAAMVILNHSTGHVVGIGGNLDENQYATGLNRATQTIRQTGSSMKPIADIAPGLQEKVITAATKYDDIKTNFGGKYEPGEWNRFLGPLNIRESIRTSQNIPMVKIMRELTPEKAIQYLEKMGITTLNERDRSLPLSIGGLDKGISPLEMAGAYGTIANNGVYITPIFYTKIVDKDGNTVLTPKQEQTKVFSEQNAYLTREIIKEPLKSGGTAGYCAIPGKDTCAKTGSTDKYVDRWLCGMTPYYTATCWWGFDYSEPLKNKNGTVYSVNGNNPAGQLWSTVMKSIHKDLPGKTFSKPTTGLTGATICKITGGVATSTCKETYSEIFTTDNVPAKCEGHGTQTLCKQTGKKANEYCPEKEEVSYGGVMPKEQLGLWKSVSKPSETGKKEVTETCDVHKKPEEKPQEKPQDKPQNNVVNNNTINNTVNNTVNTNNTTGNNTTNNTTTNTSAGKDNIVE